MIENFDTKPIVLCNKFCVKYIHVMTPALFDMDKFIRLFVEQPEYVDTHPFTKIRLQMNQFLACFFVI